MSWPKPTVTPLTPPSKPRLWVWVTLFCVFIVVSLGVFAFFWNDDRYLLQPTFWILGLLSATLFGGVMLGVRGYLYGLAVEKYEIWGQEQDRIHTNWQNWAMKHTSVLSHYLLSPISLSAESIVSDRRNIPTYFGQTLSFEPGWDIGSVILLMLHHMTLPLKKLPQNTKLTIDAYSSEPAYTDLKKIIQAILPYLKLELTYEINSRLLTETQAENVQDWVEMKPDEVRLVIVNNIHSDAFPFVVGMLLGDPDHCVPPVPRQDVPRILRPMISTESESALRQMAEMQPTLKSTQTLWFGNVSKPKEIDFMCRLSDLGVSPEDTHFLASLVGNHNFLSYWFMLALASDLAKDTKTTQLVIAGGANKEYIFTAIDGNHETLP